MALCLVELVEGNVAIFDEVLLDGDGIVGAHDVKRIVPRFDVDGFLVRGIAVGDTLGAEREDPHHCGPVVEKLVIA